MTAAGFERRRLSLLATDYCFSVIECARSSGRRQRRESLRQPHGARTPRSFSPVCPRRSSVMPRTLAFILILLFTPNICAAQDAPTAEAELARRVAASESEEERAALVAGAGEPAKLDDKAAVNKPPYNSASRSGCSATARPPSAASSGASRSAARST